MKGSPSVVRWGLEWEVDGPVSVDEGDEWGMYHTSLSHKVSRRRSMRNVKVGAKATKRVSIEGDTKLDDVPDRHGGECITVGTTGTFICVR